MRKVRLLRLLLAVVVFAFTATSCEKLFSDKDDDQSEKVTNEFFDFATTASYKFDIDYKLPFNVPVVFYVYDEYPFLSGSSESGQLVLKNGLEPVSKGITENYGKFSGLVSIKKAVKELYVYTPTVGAISLLKTKLTGNSFQISANNSDNFVEETATTKSASVSSVDTTSTVSYLTLGKWDTQGLPKYLMPDNYAVPASLMNDINVSLPSGKRVTENHPSFIKGGVNASLKVTAPAKVELVFLSEGAEYKNIVGYFHYPTGEVPTSMDKVAKIIAFPNTSFKGSGGSLVSGNKVQLKYWDGKNFQETFPAGTSIGWFLMTNGFNPTKTKTNLFNSKNLVDFGVTHYYSLDNFNPETDPLKKAHSVLLYDPETQFVVLGFEDLIRTSNSSSDEDFNDAVFGIKATPEASISYDNIPVVIKSDDKDGDGVPNGTDEFPDDPELAYTRHYPREGAYYTLAYEDMWPMKGDYDMNDVVVTYHSKHYINSKGKVVKIEDSWKPVWSGGKLDVGFGYQLGVPTSAVKSVEKISPQGNFKNVYIEQNGLEVGQEKATIMVFSNILDFGLKTLSPENNKLEYKITAKFNEPQSLIDITVPPYNPFIVMNTKGTPKARYEVHLPNFAPTSLADKNVLGTVNDKSDIAKGRYYLSADNMPFAIQIPVSNYRFPDEFVSISKFYPGFNNWVKTLGSENDDWYNQLP